MKLSKEQIENTRKRAIEDSAGNDPLTSSIAIQTEAFIELCDMALQGHESNTKKAVEAGFAKAIQFLVRGLGSNFEIKADEYNQQIDEVLKSLKESK